jgi:hypothetical protein
MRRRRSAGRNPYAARPAVCIVVHLDRAIYRHVRAGHSCSGCELRAQGYVSTCARPRRGIACMLGPGTSPCRRWTATPRARGRGSGGDRETRAIHRPCHKKASRHAALVRPRSGPSGARARRTPPVRGQYRAVRAQARSQLVGDGRCHGVAQHKYPVAVADGATAYR